jgi:citrate lyase subunit beta/citryl-CoA lyase
MQERPSRPRRSVLYVPASNERALAKISALACDAVIVDLEDAVVPDEKSAAREKMRRFFGAVKNDKREFAIRINALSSEWGTEDLLAARACRPDAILLPKVGGPRDVLDADEALDEMDTTRTLALWAMIETPRALLNIGAIAELGRDPAARLACLVAGTNDLAKETGIRDRRYLSPALTQMVLAARAGGLDVLDGVTNDFRDLEAFSNDCEEARAMGFDGKTLIHPAQIKPANTIFAPWEDEIAESERIVAAFARTENATKGVISIDGRMVERLHLEHAEKLLAKARLIEGLRT